MPTWWRGRDTVTVYHGTSSALLPAIRTQGLRAPELTSRGLRALAATLWPQVRLNNRDWDEVVAAVTGGRIDARTKARSLYAFPAPAFGRAARYARSLAGEGGETRQILRQALAVRAGLDLPPAFPAARPVVLEIETPRARLRAHRDLDALADRIRAAWQAGEDFASGFDCLEALFAEVSDFEVRLDGPLAPGHVTAVHPLDA